MGLLWLLILLVASILSLRCGMISLIFLPYLNFDNGSINTLFLLYFNSWIATISFLLVSKALRHMEISTVTPFLSFGPIFVLIFSLIFLKEKVTNIQIFGIGMVILGTYILESKKHDYLAPIKKILQSKYIHYIFIALILNGISSTLDRYFLKDISLDSVSYLFLISTFLAINYCLLVTVLKGGFKDINSGFKVNGLMILIIAALILMSRLALYESFILTSAFLVEPVKRISVLFVIIFGGVLFHEKYLFKKFIASLFMLTGVYLITI